MDLQYLIAEVKRLGEENQKLQQKIEQVLQSQNQMYGLLTQFNQTMGMIAMGMGIQPQQVLSPGSDVSKMFK